MAEEIIKRRVWTKVDTLENWNNNPLLLGPGEMALVTTPSGIPLNMKWGDKNERKRFSDLPFVISYDQGQFVIVDGPGELPTPESDVAYSLVGPGTYTYPGQDDIVVEEGHWGQVVYSDGEWSFIDMGELPQTEVVDNLSTEDPDKSLSANMGVSLASRITEVKDIIGVGYGVVDVGSKQNYTSSTSVTTLATYILNNVTLNRSGVLKSVSIFHSVVTAGQSFDIVQMRYDSSADKYVLINTIEKNISGSNSLQEYSIPDWEYQSGDFIGVVSDVNNLVKYSAAGVGVFEGMIFVDSSGDRVNPTLNTERDLSLSFSVDVGGATVSEDIEDLRSENSGLASQIVDVNEELSRIDASLGDLPTPGTNTYQIGVTDKLTSKTSQSETYKYFLNNYSYGVGGIVKSIAIANTDNLPENTPITIVQMRFDSEGQKYILVNSITLNSGESDSWNTYTVPDWSHEPGDQYGIEIDSVAAVSYFSSAGGLGLIPVFPDLTANINGFPTGRLSLYANIEVFEDAKTVQDRLVDLEEGSGGGGGGTHYLPRPSNGVVNFQVPININIADVDSNTLNQQDELDILNDWGLLLLPTNYDPNGKPVRLIIVCHGTGTYITGSSTTSTASSFWLSQGYALLDMNGLPDGIIGTGTNSQIRHYGSPYALQSYLKGYQWAIQNYNIHREVFTYGISMGGLASFMLTQSGSLPVIAQAGFCPCIDLFKQAYSEPWNGANQRRYISQLFGFEGVEPTFTTTEPPTQAEIDYFFSNYDKVVGYENMLKNVFSDYDLEDLYNDFDEVTEAPVYENLKKHHRVPLKIWHNDDDGTVRIRYSQYYVDMVNNAGGLAVLRRFPSGGHNAWLNGEVVTGIPTISGGTTSIASSMYECMLWFKRFE